MKDKRKSIDLNTGYHTLSNRKPDSTMASPVNFHTAQKFTKRTQLKASNVTLGANPRLGTSPVDSSKKTIGFSKSKEQSFHSRDLAQEEKMQTELTMIATKLNNLLSDYSKQSMNREEYSELVTVMNTHLAILDDYLLNAKPDTNSKVIAMIRRNEARLITLVKVVSKKTAEMEHEFEQVAKEYQGLLSENIALTGRLSTEETKDPKHVDMTLMLKENEELQRKAQEQRDNIARYHEKEKKVLRLLRCLKKEGFDIDMIYQTHATEIDQEEAIAEDDLLAYPQSPTRRVPTK
eukprot:TRINITY_DN13513_c0_g2_i2.p1 TRINITY_DN13513_c0_g2~~TRINITY_DN13513_c0_g2_i2.p1  ORF type:complete len:292 (+),score=58.56 TRINITY_DN13513_c0_g2_i2:181-1056(+)